MLGPIISENDPPFFCAMCHFAPPTMKKIRSPAMYISDLGDLLYYMMTEYQDIDVQDKARFYYALLTGAADKKVFTPIG